MFQSEAMDELDLSEGAGRTVLELEEALRVINHEKDAVVLLESLWRRISKSADNSHMNA